MTTAVLAQPTLETKIHQAATTKRVRFNEFFKDFDRLRTGEISESQFKRCIYQSFGLNVSETDFNEIKRRYGSKRNFGMINYRDFVRGLQIAPARGEGRTSPTERIAEILRKIKAHYDFRGIVLSDCFEDFDRHNSGLVTDSQFWRCFPSAPELTDTDTSLLINTYRHNGSNLISYMKFQEDLEALSDDESSGLRKDRLVARPTPPPSPSPSQPIETLLEKVKLRVYKDGIRSTEFFIDHDKLRSGLITKNQFIIGLNLICGDRCPLTREDMDKIASHYTGPDGRVCYREFCFLMENAFNVPHLEKNPTATVNRPKTGELAQPVNVLSEEDEIHVRQVLYTLQDYVTRRRITMLYPFFKDFDRGKLFSRGVTKEQFRRLLNFFDVDLSDKDCDVLCKKFQEPNGTDVNYPAFVEAIDSDRDRGPVKGDAVTRHSATPSSKAGTKPEPPQVDIAKLIERLKCEIKVYRVRVCEHFKDFDGLKSGSISKSLFQRGLTSMQGNHKNLTPAELEALSLHYSDPRTPGNVRWVQLERDIESITTELDLEKKRTFRVCSSDLDTRGSVDKDVTVDEETAALASAAIARMKEQIAQRRIMTKPCFQDFDRHNYGYISASQFAQGLSYLGLESTEGERRAIESLYGNDKGINYHKFFGDLDPVATEPRKYEKNLAEMISHIRFREAGTERLLKNEGCKTVEGVLDKIKETVMKRRIRLLEFFKDYDKLTSGRILKSNFTRALDLCGLNLTVDEIDLLAKEYQSDVIGKEDCIYYHQFNDEIESIFSVKGLEKSPTAQVVQYKITPEYLKNTLSTPLQKVYCSVMKHLAQFVKTRRMVLYPMFEDYDRCRNGTVTYSQFRRVLCILCWMTDELEFHALQEQYKVRIGGMNVFNYLAFCDDINETVKQIQDNLE